MHAGIALSTRVRGQPGTGKTTIALDFAATVSSGGRWPDGTLAEPGNVVIWSGEDDTEDVLVPRLRAMAADMTRIFFVGTVRRGVDASAFDPASDMPALEDKAVSIGGVRLLIVDPVVSAVAGDSHKNAETRRSLQPLVNLAQRLDCTALHAGGVSRYRIRYAGFEPDVFRQSVAPEICIDRTRQLSWRRNNPAQL